MQRRSRDKRREEIKRIVEAQHHGHQRMTNLKTRPLMDRKNQGQQGKRDQTCEGSAYDCCKSACSVDNWSFYFTKVPLTLRRRGGKGLL